MVSRLTTNVFVVNEQVCLGRGNFAITAVDSDSTRFEVILIIPSD